MIDLFANPSFTTRFSMEVVGGNHSRACYQKLILEIDAENSWLKSQIEKGAFNPYTGITQYSTEGLPVNNCVDTVLYFNLRM